MLDNIRKMKIGQKYTLVSFSFIGCPYKSVFTLRSVRCESFQQYSDSYLLTGRSSKGRQVLVRLHAGKQVIIWDGVVSPNIDFQVAKVMKDYEGGHVALLKRWRHFDPRYMEKARHSVMETPIVDQCLPVPGGQVQLFDLCTVIN